MSTAGHGWSVKPSAQPRLVRTQHLPPPRETACDQRICGRGRATEGARHATISARGSSGAPGYPGPGMVSPESSRVASPMPRPPPVTMTPGPRSVRSIAGRLEYRGFIVDEPMRPPESAGPPDFKDREHYGGKQAVLARRDRRLLRVDRPTARPAQRGAGRYDKGRGGVLLAMGLATPAVAAAGSPRSGRRAPLTRSHASPSSSRPAVPGNQRPLAGAASGADAVALGPDGVARIPGRGSARFENAKPGDGRAGD